MLKTIKRIDEISSIVKFKIETSRDRNDIDLKISALTKSDKEFCYDALEKVSRSFAMVIKQLPEDLKDAVAIFYLILRGLDSVEDDMNINSTQKENWLRSFNQLCKQKNFKLSNVGDTENYKLLMENFHKVISVYHSLPKEIIEIIDDVTFKMGNGMADYQDYPINSTIDYDIYCHYVAGLVGIGLSSIFSVSGYENPELQEKTNLSNAMGLFLQKTNITRDIKEDYDAGRKFWPEEIWRNHSEKISSILEEPQKRKSIDALNHMIKNALNHLPDCIEYLKILKNERVFRFCAIPQLMAIATLVELYDNPKTLEENLKIRKGLSAKIVMNTQTFEDFKALTIELLKELTNKLNNSKYSDPEIWNIIKECRTKLGIVLVNPIIFLMKAKYDICIVGAGVAGATLANILPSHLSVCVIEKDWREQDRIVGELLQPDGLNQLKEMKLDFILENMESQSVIGYEIIKSDESIKIPYPFTHKGLGFRNGRFIQKLRERIKQNDTIDCISETVKELIYNESGDVIGVQTDKNRIFANITFVADGFFSKLRKETTHNKEKLTGYFLGMLIDREAMPSQNFGHVILTYTNPILCYPISDKYSRILIDFTEKTPPKKGEDLIHHLNEFVRPFIPPKMLSAYDNAVKEAKFKIMPNHYMPSNERKIDGVVTLGDALNMRHPTTGGGMTVSLRDVNTIRKLLTNINLSDKKSRMIFLDKYYESRKQHAVVNILADALHEVLINQPLQRACFNYLKLGGIHAEDPVALLSGIEKSKMKLTLHFFGVAIKECKKNISKNFGVKSIKESFKMLNDAWRIIYPLTKNELKLKIPI